MTEARKFPFWPLLALGVLVLYAAYHLHHVLIPFALSFALAYVMNPLITFFEVRGLRRSVVVAVLYLLALAAAVLAANTLISVVSGELTLLKTELPGYIARSRHFLENFQVQIARRLPYGSLIAGQVGESLIGPLVEGAQNLPGYLIGLVPLLSLLFLVPFIAFFLMIDGSNIIGGSIQACPSRYVEQGLHLLSEIDTSLGNYLRGIVIVAAAIAAASFVGLVLLEVNQALAIAVLSGVSSFVPYLGAAMGAVVGGLVATFQFGSAAAGLKVVALFIGIRLADEAFLQPVIAKHSVHLHPLVFLLSLMIGGEVFGFIGLVFAVPMACVLKALFKVGWSWYSSEARLVAQTVDAAAIPYT